jgi:hypothetical protein
MAGPVTDPELLKLLEGNGGGPRPVTDPELLSRLEGRAEPTQERKLQPEMRAYDPTLRDKAAMGVDWLMAHLLGEDPEARASPFRQRIVQGMVGSRGQGHTNPSIADFTPAAPIFGAQEGQRAMEKGNYGEAALDALSVMPATGAPVASAIKTYKPRGFGWGMGMTEASREQAAAGKVAAAAQQDLASPASGIGPARPASTIGPQDMAANAVAKIGQAQAGQDVRLMDVGEKATASEVRRVANVSPAAHTAISNVTEPRFEGQTDRAINFLKAAFNNPQDATKTISDLKQQARVVNGVNYKSAWGTQKNPVTVNAPGLQKLMQSDFMQEVYGEAVKRWNTLQLAGKTSVPQSHGGVMTLQFWDQMKRVLDDKIDQASPEMAMALRSVKEQMVGYLEKASPKYKAAKGAAADFFKAGDAVEAGQAVVHGKWTPAEIAEATKKMKQAELAQFQGGFLSDYLKELSFVRDRRSVLGHLMNSPGEREKIKAVLGQKGADNFEAFLAVEEMMDKARTALGNSTTVRQALDVQRGASGLADVPLPAAVGAAAAYATGNWKTAIVGAIMYGARRAQRAVDEDVAARVADMLLSKDPAVYAKGMREVYKSEPLRSSIQASAMLGAQSVSAGSAPFTHAEPEQVSSFEDALKLKKGTLFRDPNGVMRVR